MPRAYTFSAILAVILCGYASLPSTSASVDVRGGLTSTGKCSGITPNAACGGVGCTQKNDHCKGTTPNTCFSSGATGACGNAGCTPEGVFSCT